MRLADISNLIDSHYDLDKLPFSNDGGLKKLDKVFKGETTTIIKELNDYLYA